MITDEIRARFPGAEGYLNTASIGLPSEATVAALEGESGERHEIAQIVPEVFWWITGSAAMC